MVISQIVGGLGNQLFQYAFARRLSLYLDQDLFLDLDFFEDYHVPDVFRLDKFNLSYQLADNNDVSRLKRIAVNGIRGKIYRRKKKKNLYQNIHNHYDQKWFYNNSLSQLDKKKDIYLSGYFANPYFFYEIEDLIVKEFTLKNALNLTNKKMKEQIESTNSVSLHIRRGDYVNNSLFANIPLSYYEEGISIFKEKYVNPVFFIFSDDLQWAMENLKINSDMVFVDINDRKTDFMELNLMSSCKNNIIANSTFSWWGAYLNQNKDKTVIAPKVWYKQKGAQAGYSKRKVYQKGWQKI